MRVFDIVDNFSPVQKEFKIGKSNYWMLAEDNDFDIIKGILPIDEGCLNECKEIKQSSKINFFDGYIYIDLNALDYNEKTIKCVDLNIFLGKDYILTFCKEQLKIIEELIKDINGLKNCFMLKDNPKPYIILYYILDRIIVNNYGVISQLEEKTDEIEISILKKPRHEQVDELIYLRRQVYKIRKYVNPLRYIGDSLIGNDNSIIEKASMQHFHSLNNKIDKLMLSLESLVQDLALVREAFESEIANKTNELMKVFTIIATIFLPLNLITSMYGMNVKHIPFTDLDHGYYFVIGIMVIVTLYLVYIFKKKRWL